jgi:hypothetical protein
MNGNKDVPLSPEKGYFIFVKRNNVFYFYPPSISKNKQGQVSLNRP